ncbi:MAG: phosphoglycerate mutase [Burkholderiales bacterium RIFCSPLOWO2_02_FULL_57_36]|nr:MAG: phosphoglycerate mutase [Burkholderiales bacterium RIFCSPLOWO2_02_FULL_57_36]
MTEILLIRHGETEWNAVKRLQGHLDIALNAEGERQAAALGQALLDETLDVIVASDLQRAMQTAHAIAQPRGMTIQADPGLRERCYGAFEGVMYSEIEERFPEAYATWQARDIDARFPDGIGRAETLREFYERAITTINRLALLHKGKKIALVTHGGILECAYRAANDVGLLAARDFDVFNASINRVVWTGAAMHVLEWGNVAHLTQTVLDEIDK